MGYGTFRTPQGGASLGLGTDKLGIFTAVNASRSDRFLDTPEEAPHHADGHNVNVFTRLDYPWYRHDRIDYGPSASPLADQPATMAQVRTLTNFGAKADPAAPRMSATPGL